MTVAVPHLSKVMDIFSDILTKSRFEQRPNAGNFIPRPNPKKNTTNLTKEFKPVPGTYNYRRDPDSTAKPKGKKAAGELVSDGGTPDDATFVEGLEKAEGTSGARGWKTMRKFPYRMGSKQVKSDKHKNIDRATIRKPETFESMQKAKRHKLMDMINTRMKEAPATKKNAEKSQQGDYSPTLKRNFTPEEQKRVDFVRQIRAERGKSDSSTPPKQPRSARAMEEDRFDAHKRKMGIPTDVYIKPGERHGFGGYDSYATQEGGRLEHMEKANILKAFGVSNKKKSDGGEKYASGARGRTPALLGMRKASKKIKDMTGEERVKAYNEGKLRLNRSYRPGQGPHPDFAQKPIQRELPFSTEDRDHIAPTPESHGDDLPEPTRRGGSKQGSRRKGDIPKEGWKEAALLWGKQSNGKGRKVKTRTNDSIGVYPT